MLTLRKRMTDPGAADKRALRQTPRVSTRFEAEPFRPEHVAPAARLLAERHARHRAAWPALNPEFESVQPAADRIEALLEQGQQGVFVSRDGDTAAYLLGGRKPDTAWGPNAWVDEAGNAGADMEAIRVAYGAAARPWVEDGRTSHFVVVPATDEDTVAAWFSVGFGAQHVHALREMPGPDFTPHNPGGLPIRRSTRGDLPVLAELSVELPRHLLGSPVFSRALVPSVSEELAELEADFDDPKLTSFVAEHDGRVVGEAVGCALEVSSLHGPLMRPASCAFLGFVAVLPDARGLGAGRALGDTVMAWARDAGYEWLATEWRSTNIEADRTWRAMGFRPTFLRLHRAIA